MTEDKINRSLVLTKLNQPNVSRELVQRPRLLEQLRSPARLILVVAPAGYGKTTLLRTWLEECPLPSAWLSLDDQDNDLSLFVSYLIAAVKNRFPTFGGETTSLLGGIRSPSLAVISRSLLSELAALKQEFVLVLDDYHLIHNSAIHQLLTDLLRYPPPALHLVMASRINPALPLPGLRAKGIVQELRAADLRFTLDETSRLIRDVMHLEMTDEDLVVLENRTEGWPASVRLAVIHFKQSGYASLVGANQQGNNRHIIDYLVTEVTNRLPENVQSFLMRTSILDSLSAPLCDAVMMFAKNSGKSRKQLDWLQDVDFFTLPVKNAPGWFRYHHLFRQYLLIELNHFLPPKEIAALHMRASAWYDSQGMGEEAIRHALAAGDVPTAVRIFAGHRREMMNREEWKLLERWLQLFPREVIEQRPELILHEVFLMFMGQQMAGIPARLDQAEALLKGSSLTPADRRRLRGELAARHSQTFYYKGETARSIQCARQALKDLPPEWWHIRSHARLFLSGCLVDEGRLAQALDNLYNSGEPDHGSAFQARMLTLACFIHWLAADLSSIEKAATQTLAWSEEASVGVERRAWANYYLGILYYQRNDFNRAEHHLMQVVLHPYQAQVACFLHGAAAMALIYQARGQLDEALELADVMATYALEGNNPVGFSVATALKAELALRQGRLSEAVQWTEQYSPPKVLRFPYFYVEPITLAQVLLAQDTPASRKQAGQVLSDLYKKFSAKNQTRWLINVLALQALLCQAKGRKADALKALKKAVSLAEPGGFIRAFVDLGAPMKSLLATLARKKVSPEYLAELLVAFDEEETRLASARKNSPLPESDSHSLVKLSNREREVLELLAMRYTDKEISEALIISHQTVHSHISHISDKLDVHGRRAIVQAAKEQGLLK